jgi:hypothetical protein
MDPVLFVLMAILGAASCGYHEPPPARAESTAPSCVQVVQRIALFKYQFANEWATGRAYSTACASELGQVSPSERDALAQLFRDVGATNPAKLARCEAPGPHTDVTAEANMHLGRVVFLDLCFEVEAEI